MKSESAISAVASNASYFLPKYIFPARPLAHLLSILTLFRASSNRSQGRSNTLSNPLRSTTSGWAGGGGTYGGNWRRNVVHERISKWCDESQRMLHGISYEREEARGLPRTPCRGCVLVIKSNPVCVLIPNPTET